MTTARIIVQEHDDDTQTKSCLDIFDLELPDDPKKLRKLVLDRILPLFAEAAGRRGQADSIEIEFTR